MAKAIPTEPRANRVQRTTTPAPRRGLIRNFEDILGELRKVIGPSWGELRTMTSVDIVTVVGVSLMLGLIAYVLTQTLVKLESPKVGGRRDEPPPAGGEGHPRRAGESARPPARPQR